MSRLVALLSGHELCDHSYAMKPTFESTVGKLSYASATFPLGV
jgi:hypothetical protein